MKIKLVAAALFGWMLFFALATPVRPGAYDEDSKSPAAKSPETKTRETSVFHVPDTMVGDLFAVLCYGILAITLIVVGYKVIDLATPGIHFEHHVANGNMAAAVVFASMILGLCYVIAHVVAAIMGLRTS